MEAVAQATPEIRRELLRAISAPQGTITIVRHPTPQGDEIVVSLAPGIRIPSDRMPRVFKGVPVRYETRKLAKAFA